MIASWTCSDRSDHREAEIEYERPCEVTQHAQVFGVNFWRELDGMLDSHFKGSSGPSR